MPSIEIACLGITKPEIPIATSFGLRYETGMKSHRVPRPRFQSDFDSATGWLYHIVDSPEIYNAYTTLSEDSRHSDGGAFLEFGQEHRASAELLVSWLLHTSTCGRILFTSDYQFGPDWTRRFNPISEKEFWGLHDDKQLLLNSAYPIHAAA